MGTPYSTLINSFLRRIEKDGDFFDYVNLSGAESLVLATTRAQGYLEEALGKIAIECQPSVDFSDIDEDEATGAISFNFDLTIHEKFLIPSLMYEVYLNREFAYLKNLSVNYTPVELRVFDPSNARSTFLDIYKLVQEENIHLMDLYKSTDRATGTFVGIDYSFYNDDE